MCADHIMLLQGKLLGQRHHYFMVVTCFLEWILCLGLIFLCVGVTFLGEIYYLEWYYSDMWSRDGWRHHFMVFTSILVWFFSVLVEIFVLVWFRLSWCHFIPWCNQLNLGMIFLRLDWNFRLGVILLVLVLFHILVQSIESYYFFFSFW